MFPLIFDPSLWTRRRQEVDEHIQRLNAEFARWFIAPPAQEFEGLVHRVECCPPAELHPNPLLEQLTFQQTTGPYTYNPSTILPDLFLIDEGHVFGRPMVDGIDEGDQDTRL